MDNDALTASEFQSTSDTQDWRVIGADALAWFPTASHAEGAALARRVLKDAGSRAEIDLDIRAKGVRARIVRPGSRFTSAGVETARAVSAAAADLGLTADPSGLQLVQIGIDTQDTASLMRFWEEVLGHERRGEVVLRDPHRRLPSLWFQELDEPRPLRNRLHLDVVTPAPGAAYTLAAIPELDGQIPQQNDFYATIADTDGNEADILPLPDGADRWEGEETEDWRLVFAAMAAYRADGAAAADLVDQVAALADDAGLALGIDIRPGLVILDSGKDRWEMEEGYDALAAQVQAVARGLGAVADVSLPRFVQVGIDAVDIEAVRTFWAAALGYDRDPREGVTDLVHPHHLTMPLFVQNLDAEDHERRAQRNRIHLDVFVADDQAQARVDAALAAGGRITYDAEAPAWWTIADPEGNEVCLAVSPGREERWGE